MNEVRNLSRYWIDKDSGILVRPWTDEEYKSTDPHRHIFEKYWSYYCPICGFLPIPVMTKEEAKRQQAEHVNRFCSKRRHKGVVEYRNHELICMEHKDEFIESFGVWVHRQEMY